MPDCKEDKNTFLGAVLYGLLFGLIFGLGCCVLSLWNYGFGEYPVWKIVVGYGGFTVVSAIACATVSGLSWCLQWGIRKVWRHLTQAD